jgi:hypothetical protein
MPMPKAECGNQAVDRFADGVTLPAEIPEVSCGCDSEFLAATFKELEPAKFAQDAIWSVLISQTLENLAENQVRQSEALPAKLTIKVIGLGVLQTTHVVDPDGRIDEYHR